MSRTSRLLIARPSHPRRARLCGRAIATIHSDTRYFEPILQAALDGLRPD